MISVCIAAYNGERFIARQLETILEQLGRHDEVVIVDDCSKDKTIEIIQDFGDPRIILHRNERNRREVYSFSKAIEKAKGEFLFLADQDDVWLPGRVKLMIDALNETGAAFVATNFEWMTADEEPLDMRFDGVRSADSERHLKNVVDVFIGRTNYFGCAMAIKRELVPLITPIPAYVESHDIWIAFAGNLLGSTVHLDEKTFRKRWHGQNATSTTSTRKLYLRMWARVIFARSLLELAFRRLRYEHHIN